MRANTRGRPGLTATLVLLVLLVVGTWIAGNSLLVVEDIRVEGNLLLTDQQVVEAAGLQIGQSMLTLDLAAVRAGVNANHYLQFVSLYRDYPSTILLRVRENMPSALIRTMGMLVIIDSRGVVLNQTSQIDLNLDVPFVEGMDLKSVLVGRALTTQNPVQAQAMQAILGELETQQAMSEISELNMSDLDNLYLVTVDGIQVLLGDTEGLMDKIAMMRATLPEVRNMGTLSGSVLDVTARLMADYQRPKTYHTPKPTATPTDAATPDA